MQVYGCFLWLFTCCSWSGGLALYELLSQPSRCVCGFDVVDEVVRLCFECWATYNFFFTYTTLHIILCISFPSFFLRMSIYVPTPWWPCYMHKWNKGMHFNMCSIFSATSCILKYVFYPECPNSMAVVGRYCRTSLMGLRSVLLKLLQLICLHVSFYLFYSSPYFGKPLSDPRHLNKRLHVEVRRKAKYCRNFDFSRVRSKSTFMWNVQLIWLH